MNAPVLLGARSFRASFSSASGTIRFGCSYRLLSSKKPPRDVTDELYEDLNQRIRLFKKKFYNHARASLIARTAGYSIKNLRGAIGDMKEKQKKSSADNRTAANPSSIILEVLSNGATHLRPCVLIRTPLNVYIFNCPEGTSRFLADLRLRINNVNDVFLTRVTWDEIGGLCGVLLAKEQGSSVTRLHGAVDVRQFFEYMRPFADPDLPAARYFSEAIERPLSLGSYSDAALTVHYLPVIGLRKQSDDPQSSAEPISLNQVEIAYLVEPNEPPCRIDPAKLVELRIPSGPHIGQLKNGEDVTLPDGRLIKSTDVLLSNADVKQHNVLIVDCSKLSALPSLQNNSLLQKYMKEEKMLSYCVHYTPQNVLETEEYCAWMHSLGANCSHLIVNGTGPALPHLEAIYRNQALLSHINPRTFPTLPSHFEGVIYQDDECERRDNLFYVRPIQRFHLRGLPDPVDPTPISICLTKKDIFLKINESKAAAEAVNVYKKFLEGEESKNARLTPRLHFLGTSSAVPSKYRNVSSYLLELNEGSCIMVDCGEGTYGQMRVLFGDERCTDMLINLKAVFVTHGHIDHMNGLYTIIVRRYEAFRGKGIPYKALTLACNANVMKPLRIYSKCFMDLEVFFRFVNTSPPRLAPPRRPEGCDLRDRTSTSWDVFFPHELFDEAEWGLQKARAVQVHHTRMAVGYVFTLSDGRKVVFSGDTKPCELLVEHGSDAFLLVHEATFADEFERDAANKKHSTMRQAVDVGQRMRARHIILTHFSARYAKAPPLPEYLEEAGNISVAVDNLSVCFDDLHLLPKLIPVYRELYEDDLFTIQLRAEQRMLKENEEEQDNSERKHDLNISPAISRKRKAAVEPSV